MLDDDDVTPPLEDEDDDEVTVPLEVPPEDEDELDDEDDEDEEEDELLEGGTVELAPVVLLFGGSELAPVVELGLGLLELLALTALDPSRD